MSHRIRYYSLLDGCGYGDAATDYMAELVARGHEVSWSPLAWTQRGLAPWRLLPPSMRPDLLNPAADPAHRRQRFRELVERPLEADTVIMHCMPELWPKLREPGKVNIGYTVWESDRLPGHWPPLIPAADHVLVPTEFNRPLFTLPGGPPVTVVPHVYRESGSATPAECRAFRRRYGIPDEHVCFYSINSWTPRKATWSLLHAYLLAFDAADRVTLVIKTDREGVDPAARGAMRPVREMVAAIRANYPNPARIVLIDDYLPDEEITLLHQAADCYVSLTHAEGWGMGAFDAASVGRPVIMTGWGGQLDFLPADLAYLVDYRLGPVTAYPGWDSYTADQQWAIPDIDSAIARLREVYRDPATARTRGAGLGRHVTARFSRRVVMDRFEEALRAAHT